MLLVSRTDAGGCDIEGEDESWDFGTGAGFYVDATEDPWKTNYRMYSYITDEVWWISVTCSLKNPLLQLISLSDDLSLSAP